MSTTTLNPETIAVKLQQANVAPDAHHMTIKKAIEKVTGAKPTKDEYTAVREALTNLPEDATDDLMAKANAIVEQRAADPDMPGWEHVIGISEVGVDGAPARVIVACSDPQTLRDGTEICEEEREIAAQDVFQVRRCAPCQKRSNALARNARAKAKRAEAKAATA